MSQAESGPQAGTAAAHARQSGGQAVLLRRLLIGGLFLVPVILGLYVPHALLGLFILGGLLGTINALRQMRDIADTPTSKIRSAAQGYVEIVARGSATDAEGAAIAAPLTGSPCCYWELDAQRRIKRDKDRVEWQTEAFIRSVPELLSLGDGTGICHVMIAEAEIHAGIREERAATPEQRQALAHLFPAHQRPRLDRQAAWRLVETRLPADLDLYAIGRFESFRSNRVPFDDSWNDRMVGADEGIPVHLRKMVQMLQGKVAPPLQDAVARWQDRMRRLEGSAPGAPLMGTAMAHVLGPDRSGGRSRPLILSATPERGLIRRYRLQAVGGVAMALIATALLVVFLFDAHPESMQAVLQSLGAEPPALPANQPKD